MKRLLITFITLLSLHASFAADVLVEAESFTDKGGWAVDQQFMDLMGSPYLIAHGMGVPVADAETTATVPEDGRYRVWVRTYNWTAPWTDAKGPGRFRVGVGRRYKTPELGCTGDRWQWQDGGVVKLKKGAQRITLTDKTGFDGRVDAILLTTELDRSPEERFGRGHDWRFALLGGKQPQAKQFDFVVVGGGIAGMCAAVTAARLGCRVALVNDRPVLGGNNSSEVRVHLGGIIETGQYPALGRIIREFGHSRGGNAKPGSYYEDAKKDSFVLAEPNVTLFAGWHATGVKASGGKISSVTIQNIETAERIVLSAPIFSDCTGDGSVGVWAGADFAMGREARSDYGESMAPEAADSTVMGASIQWYSEKSGRKSRFPEFSYGVEFNEGNAEKVTMGEWTWETGMNRNQITEAERIRDYGLLVVYSNWSFLKNRASCRADYAHRRLAWVAYVLGKRDVNSARFPGNEFKTRTVHHWIHPYAVPYRCLYSRNVDNLFMAGRNISCTHVALGTVRVMRTTGMMGEVVGMAAALCKKYGVTPRGVYHHHLAELRSLMEKGAGRADAPDNQRFNEPNETLPLGRRAMLPCRETRSAWATAASSASSFGTEAS